MSALARIEVLTRQLAAGGACALARLAETEGQVADVENAPLRVQALARRASSLIGHQASRRSRSGSVLIAAAWRTQLRSGASKHAKTSYGKT